MELNRMISFGIVAAGCAALAPAQSGAAAQPGADASAKAPHVEPYTLSTCPVSGEELGKEDPPVVRVYDGREVRFCCKNCIAKFEADKDKYLAKIDQQIVADQLPYYPLDTCVVSGEPLTEKGKDIAVNFVYDNRLFRLCCNKCKGDIRKDPDKYIAKLDKAAEDAQRPDYPLETCPVSGEKLGSMGEPVEKVVAGRLVRFCCNGCPPKLNADPVKYLAKVDQAWHDKGMHMHGAPGMMHNEHGRDMHEEHGGMGNEKRKEHGHDDG